MVPSGVASKDDVSLKEDIPNLLVLDSFRGHLTDKVKAHKECIDLLVIPSGLTGQHQPLGRRVRGTSLDTVCGWVLSAWAAVPCDVTVRSSAKCGLTLDDVLWDRSSYEGSSTSEDDSSDHT
ncbi:hypothetical protein HPB50_028788 [Hyalomma asiaticum]|nr:hypothetical protein HPB50_028788 [Hyalomma asiaticum]